MAADRQARFAALDSSIVADVLDDLGVVDQGLAAEFAPFPAQAGKLAGPAFPIAGQMSPSPVTGGDATKMEACAAIPAGAVSVWSGAGEGVCFFGELIALGMQERGCVGALEAQRPLAQDVAENARAAAFEDARFKPLTPDEFARTDIEVSLLSTPKRLSFEDHADLVGRLRPGVDGIILEHSEEGKHSTFLPQVWEGLPDPEQFIAHLKQKAGIARNVDIRRCRVKRYSVLKWREAELGR